MIKKPEQFTYTEYHDFHGGKGPLKCYNLFDPEEQANKKVRFNAKIVLEPGCSVGLHPHEKDEEIIYVLDGDLTILEDGNEYIASAGDAAICGGGHKHGVRNDSDRAVTYLAFIILH